MTNYRLSALRTKGWVRLGLTVAMAAIPLAVVEHSLGVFSDGMPGIWQAVEFAGGAAALSLVLTLLAGWIMRGFAVRTHDEDHEHEERHAPPARGPQAPSAANLHGRPAAHH